MIAYFTVSIVIDDVVLPDGRSCMGLLGGGGPQAAFGMKLWTQEQVGICAGVGADFPAPSQRWLETLGVDVAGVRRQPQHPTLRAWQILEEDGRRTQVWRTDSQHIPAQLAFTPAMVPPAYWGARGFHFGVHPERPNLLIMQALRARGITVSVEPFRAAAQALTDEELAALVSNCDIFSPNVEEARSLVGDGAPEALVARLVEAGGQIVTLRMGDEGSLVYRAATRELHHVQRLPVTVVDPVGAGNAYCGGFLVGWLETGDLRRAGEYGTVAGSFLVEQVGLPAVRASLREEAQDRLARLAHSAAK
jgi:sugar/nucleoside kinase (ribokinase family)